MDLSIFREYDIRGVVEKQFQPSEMYDLARALTTYFIEKNPRTKTIIVAMDGRISSPAIKEQCIKAMIDTGFDVIDLGICPTPNFYFALHTLSSSTGIMITASHNPKDHNGIKVCLDGQSVAGTELQVIKNYLQTKNFYDPTSRAQGTVTHIDIITPYVAYLANAFAHLKGSELAAVIDCGNAVGGVVMPKLLEAMEWKNVQLLYENLDGTFPNHEADPTEIDNMRDVQAMMAKYPFLEVGIGLDGDADRMSPMTPQGRLVPGDQMLALYSSSVLKKHPNSPIVFDIKCSQGLIQVIDKLGGKGIMIPSGHTKIKAEMKRQNALLGGELSCHFFFKDRYFGYDDGIYAALRLIEILHETGESLDQLLTIFPEKISTSEIRIACPEDKKQSIIANITTIFAARKDTNIITVDGVRAHMPYGWGLLRASNTQPLLTLRFESDNADGLASVKHDFFNALQPYFDIKELKEKIGI